MSMRLLPFFIIAILFIINSCQTDLPETRISSITAKSLGVDTTMNVPDSLLITFNHNSNELNAITRFLGCGPIPTAHCQWNGDTLLVLIKMNDQCIHSTTEYFKLCISVAPVNRNIFRLIIAPANGDGWVYDNEYGLIDSLISTNNLNSVDRDNYCL